MFGGKLPRIKFLSFKISDIFISWIFSVTSFRNCGVLEHFQKRCSIDSSLVLQKEQLRLSIAFIKGSTLGSPMTLLRLYPQNRGWCIEYSIEFHQKYQMAF